VRRLALITLIGANVLFVLVPRMIEAWWSITLPLGWFIGGVLIALVVGFCAIIYCLSRLTMGLAPAS
jgi:hypothetical protein